MTGRHRKTRLRNTLRKLASIPYGRAQPAAREAAAQEALDFLAMLAGLKPVFVLGRGFDDPVWTGGVLDVARDLGLHVVEGQYWEAADANGPLPDWYAAHVRDALAGRTAWYICRASAVADEVRAVCATGAPELAQEARLLGFPECCVAAHYRRAIAYHRLTLDRLRRAADGDEGEMARLLTEGAALEPATAEEARRLDRAMAVTPCPFTSINMCDDCATTPDSPARRLSRRYAALSRDVDEGLASALSAADTDARHPGNEGIGPWRKIRDT